MGLQAARTELIDRKNVNTPMFGKPLIQWSDEDVVATIRAYKDCDAQLHNSVIEYCMRGGARTRQWCEQANVPGLGMKMALRFETDVRDTVVVARNMDAQRRAQEAAEIRARKEQLQYQAERDREAAEAAARQAELENSQLSEVTRQAEQARRAREEAEQKLRQLREAAAAQQRQRQQDVAQTEEAERRADLLSYGYETIPLQTFELEGANLAAKAAKLAFRGAYVREGNLDMLYTVTPTAGMASGGGIPPSKVRLQIDNASRQLKEHLLTCRAGSVGSAAGCAVTVFGRATMCTLTNAFGVAREEPCLDVESGVRVHSPFAPPPP
jgi:hypothetical protein